MTKSTAALCVLMFGAPFFLFASVYHALPAELLVLRIPFANAATWAPKSAFTVFRVPSMNLTHGLMAAAMLSHAADFSNERRRASYVAM